MIPTSKGRGAPLNMPYCPARDGGATVRYRGRFDFVTLRST